MPKISVIIPNLNGEKLLPICLESIRRQTYKDFEIIVVDNGSRDASLSILKKDYPEVRIISLDKNYGFSYPVNRGIEKAKGQFVSLLNNDVELDKRWMDELLGAFERYPEIGCANPKLLRYFERDKINVIGIKVNLDGRMEIVGDGDHDRGQYNEERYIFGVSGGASMYRKAMFDDIGLFDEEFFFNYEDVDMCFRAQLAGYKALYVPSAIAYHMVGATIKKIKRTLYRPTYYNNRNSILYYWKNMPSELVKKHFVLIFAHRSYAFGQRLIRNFWKLRTFYYIMGICAGYLSMPHIIKQRKMIQVKRRVSPQYIESILGKDFLS